MWETGMGGASPLGDTSSPALERQGWLGGRLSERGLLQAQSGWDGIVRHRRVLASQASNVFDHVIHSIRKKITPDIFILDYSWALRSIHTLHCYILVKPVFWLIPDARTQAQTSFTTVSLHVPAPRFGSESCGQREFRRRPEAVTKRDPRWE